MGSNVIHLGLKTIDVWPREFEAEVCGDPSIRKITFTDTQEYHPRLVSKILEIEENQRLRKRGLRGAGGLKIHQLEKWLSAEVELISARAKALFEHVLGVEQAIIDGSWANVYRAGDYCAPHSHPRSSASVVYCLEPGDEDIDDPQGGRFCFVDPRLRQCCQEQEGCMTTAYHPHMMSGTMLIFPSQLVHAVNPYAGKRPRITMSWNLNRNRTETSPLIAEIG